MVLKRIFITVSLTSLFFPGLAPNAAANTYQIILHGKVVMEDGSVPPVIVAIERICSDNAGSAPGPLTDKKGEYIWKMEIDPLESRDCRIRATHAGYTSTNVEVSGLDTTRTALDLPPIIVNASVADVYAIIVSQSAIPGKVRADWSAAMKALDEPDLAQAAGHLEAAVEKAPKFAQAWHGLGVVDEKLKKLTEARAAYEHAIESDPKLLPPYVTLARLCIKTKDWDGAAKATEAMLKADPKHLYPEIYLYQAVARYQLKNINGAQESAQEAIRLDPKYKRPRAEYVLGRILEAKGDLAGAKEHMTKYLELQAAPSDVDLIRAHIDNLGKPLASEIDPEIEPL